MMWNSTQIFIFAFSLIPPQERMYAVDVYWEYAQLSGRLGSNSLDPYCLFFDLDPRHRPQDFSIQ
jgi:hypothetical protein